MRPLLVLAVVALTLAACGRRGPLEAPPSDTPNKGPTTTINESVVSEDNFATPAPLSASPIAKPPRTNRAVTIPKRDFFLDPLL